MQLSVVRLVVHKPIKEMNNYILLQLVEKKTQLTGGSREGWLHQRGAQKKKTEKNWEGDLHLHLETKRSQLGSVLEAMWRKPQVGGV